jgi:hypothetical protein
MHANLFPSNYELQNKQHPWDAVQNKVKPVKRPNETALEEHGYLFHDMRRLVGGKPEGETENNDETPRQFIEKVIHNGSISQ